VTETDAESTPDANSRLRNVPWRRIASVAGLILLVAIVVPFVVFTVPQVVGADHSYVVLSGSMEPAMSPGDAIIVSDVPAEQIEEGDVITFGTGANDATTHRVIEVTEQGDSVAFRTKGDANEDPDSSLVAPSEVHGRVMSVGGHLFVIPYIGHVINFADTQLGFVLLFAVPVTLLVLNEIWNLIVASRADTGSGSEAEAEAGSGSGSAAAGSGASDGADSDVDAADADADAEGETDTGTGSSESTDGGITFTTAELQLGLLVLAAFLAYSVWVAYQTLEIWSFGVAGGVASAFLLLAGLYFFGGGSDDATDGGATDAPPAATEPEADTGSDSGGESESGPEPEREPGPEPTAADDASGTTAESEASAVAESRAIDPEVELNLLEDIVGQRADDGPSPPTAADGLEQHASDGGTPPVAADDREEASSEDADRTADAGAPQEGATDE